MTLTEWTSKVSDEFRAAGFDVAEHGGFPLVKRPADLAEGVRFLEFSCSLAVDRRIYAEGCLLTPAGLPAQQEGGA